jgi:ABC-type uncharacterized transport system substrate-binding protein
MLKLLKSIWLGLTLILLASGLLLLSDLGRRQSARPVAKALPRLAVLQWFSTDLLDHTVAGMLEGLRQQGFENGRTAEIRLLNASGDGATGNTMAQELAGGSYDLVLTASTLAMQTVAKANTARRAVHVFAAVTDPYGSGVGIAGPKPDQHPAHLVGVGTFQPVEHAIRIARQMNPALHTLGTVWNPGESNSEACVKKARAACKELEIKLVEASASNTSEVPEAVRAILAQGAEAIWEGGDNVAISAIGAIVSAARAVRVPVFTNDPVDTTKGALFGLGASYHAVGLAAGEMAGKILRGASPQTFGVENLVPEVLAIDEALVREFAGWSIPAELRAQAQVAVAAAAAPGVAAAAAPPPPSAPSRPWEIRVVRYNDAQFSEDTWRGIENGFKQQGRLDGREVNLTCLNAQGDMTTLTSIMTAVRAAQPDLVMPISTPALQAALRQAGELPIVFACVGDGVLAGAGKTVTDHLPNVTGITTFSPFAAMAKLIRQAVPQARTVGTLFTPGEVNSEQYRSAFASALQAEGLVLSAVPITSSAEVAEAVTELLRHELQVVGQISDNLTRPAFAQIARRSREAKLPFFCFDSSGVKEGATLALARDFYATGYEAAELAVKVLRGAAPKDIPFANTRTETLTICPDLLTTYGVVLPAELRQRAQVMNSPTP